MPWENPHYDDHRPAFPPILVDHDAQTVTFAVTFAWRKPWAMDHCEVGSLRRNLEQILCDGLVEREWNHQIAAVDAIETWEPREERHIGGPHCPVHVLPTPPGYEEVE